MEYEEKVWWTGFENNGDIVVIELEDKTTLPVTKEKFACEVHVNDVVY